MWRSFLFSCAFPPLSTYLYPVAECNTYPSQHRCKITLYQAARDLPRPLALRASQRFVYRELTALVITVIVIVIVPRGTPPLFPPHPKILWSHFFLGMFRPPLHSPISFFLCCVACLPLSWFCSVIRADMHQITFTSSLFPEPAALPQLVQLPVNAVSPGPYQRRQQCHRRKRTRKAAATRPCLGSQLLPRAHMASNIMARRCSFVRCRCVAIPKPP